MKTRLTYLFCFALIQASIQSWAQDPIISRLSKQVKDDLENGRADLKINYGGEELNCLKRLVVYQSEFFKKMFANDFKESKQNSIKIQPFENSLGENIPVDTFKLFLGLCHLESQESIIKDPTPEKYINFFDLLDCLVCPALLSVLKEDLRNNFLHKVANKSHDLTDEQFYFAIKLIVHAESFPYFIKMSLKRLESLKNSYRFSDKEKSKIDEFKKFKEERLPILAKVCETFDEGYADRIARLGQECRTVGLDLDNKLKFKIFKNTIRYFQNDDHNSFNKILQSGILPINIKFPCNHSFPKDGTHGMPLLAYAAQNQAKKCFELLIKAKANLANKCLIPNYYGDSWTPIEWADDEMKAFIKNLVETI